MKTNVTFPRTRKQAARELEERVTQLGKLIVETRAHYAELLSAEFKRKGGCEKCGGRGWVVMWDTMDSLSGCYAEYGSCPNPECTEESRALTGLDASYHSKYDQNRGVPDPVANDTTFHAFVEPVAQQIFSMRAEIRRLSAEPQIGEDCVVVKGRKAPIGFVGRFFWSSQSEWGLKIGLRNEKGEVAWTYLANVEALLPGS